MPGFLGKKIQEEKIMKQKDWLKIQHFSIFENWGDPEKMSFDLLKALDNFRDRIDKPFIVNYGYATSGHYPNSYHYTTKDRKEAWAVDGRFKNLNIFDQFLEALKEDSFKGIGIYVFETQPFLHLDIRKQNSKLIWYRDKNKVYHYNPTFRELCDINICFQN